MKTKQALDEETCAFESDFAKVIRDLRELGILSVVAAGNENQDACKLTPQAARYAVTVGATDRDDRRAFYSNYGKCVDIMAPGTDVASAATECMSRNCMKYKKNFLDGGQYMTMMGTSQACPLVAGILALYMNVIGNNPEDALNAMLNNAEHIDTGAGDKCSSNELLAKTPGTKSKSDLNMTRAEHP